MVPPFHAALQGIISYTWFIPTVNHNLWLPRSELAPVQLPLLVGKQKMTSMMMRLDKSAPQRTLAFWVYLSLAVKVNEITVTRRCEHLLDQMCVCVKTQPCCSIISSHLSSSGHVSVTAVTLQKERAIRECYKLRSVSQHLHNCYW